jgi:hypothetical protein
MRGNQFRVATGRIGPRAQAAGNSQCAPTEMAFRRTAIEARNIHHVGEALGSEVYRALAHGARRGVIHHRIRWAVAEQRARDVEGGVDDRRRDERCVVHFTASGWRASVGTAK